MYNDYKCLAIFLFVWKEIMKKSLTWAAGVFAAIRKAIVRSSRGQQPLISQFSQWAIRTLPSAAVLLLLTTLVVYLLTEQPVQTVVPGPDQPSGSLEQTAQARPAMIPLYEIDGPERVISRSRSDFLANHLDTETPDSQLSPEITGGTAVITVTPVPTEKPEPTPYPQTTDSDGIAIEGMPVDHFYVDDRTVYVNVAMANLRDQPEASANLTAQVGKGTPLTRIGYGMSWSQVRLDNGTEGFVLTDLISLDFVPTPTPTPSPTPTPTPTPSPTPVPTTVETTTTAPTTTAPAATQAPADSGSALSAAQQQKIVDFARSFIGTPYVYASSSPSGFDCSGFTKYIYGQLFGITLPHRARDQAKSGIGVSSSDIQIGDILCFDYSYDGVVDHVGIYIGGGRYVHASASAGQVLEKSVNFSSQPIKTIRRIIY